MDTNVIMAIEPYWYFDTWVFDKDESVGLDKEPFVLGRNNC